MADTVQAYAVNADGSFTALGSAQSVGGNPGAVAVSEDGRFVYTANAAGNNITLLCVAGDGTLGGGGNTAPCMDPTALAVVGYTESQ